MYFIRLQLSRDSLNGELTRRLRLNETNMNLNRGVARGGPGVAVTPPW